MTSPVDVISGIETEQVAYTVTPPGMLVGQIRYLALLKIDFSVFGVDLNSVLQRRRQSNPRFNLGAVLELFAVEIGKHINVWIIAATVVTGHPVLVLEQPPDTDLVMEHVIVGFQLQLQLASRRAVCRKPDFGNLASLFVRLQEQQGHHADLELGLFGITQDRHYGITLKIVFRSIFFCSTTFTRRGKSRAGHKNHPNFSPGKHCIQR